MNPNIGRNSMNDSSHGDLRNVSEFGVQNRIEDDFDLFFESSELWKGIEFVDVEDLPNDLSLSDFFEKHNSNLVGRKMENADHLRIFRNEGISNENLGEGNENYRMIEKIDGTIGCDRVEIAEHTILKENLSNISENRDGMFRSCERFNQGDVAHVTEDRSQLKMESRMPDSELDSDNKSRAQRTVLRHFDFVPHTLSIMKNQQNGTGFSVSDLVWGKVKYHPWWPGQIFDPSYASSMAKKCKKNGRFLVAFFGDGTFGWCLASELKPFDLPFSDMEKQSNSSRFLHAIDCAVDEISRRTEIGLVCSCIPEKAYDGLKCKNIVNAGIQEGAETTCAVGNALFVSCFKPTKIIEHVKRLAVISFGKLKKLELGIIRAQLMAFYRSKGYLSLAEFHSYKGLLSRDSCIQSKRKLTGGPSSQTKVKPLSESYSFHYKRRRGLPENADPPQPFKKQKAIYYFCNETGESKLKRLSMEKDETKSALFANCGKKIRESRGKLNDISSLDKSVELQENIPISQLITVCQSDNGAIMAGRLFCYVEQQSDGKLHEKSTNIVDSNRDNDGNLSAIPYETLNAQRRNMSDSVKQNLSLFARKERNGSVGRTLNKDSEETLERQKDSREVENLPIDGVNCNNPEVKRESNEKKGGNVFENFNRRTDIEKTEHIQRDISDQTKNVGLSSALDATYNSRRTQVQQKDEIGKEEKINFPAELTLRFSKVDSIPSREELIRIFSHFGSLYESKTEVFKKKRCAKVVFKHSYHGDLAFSSSGKFKTFGPTLVSYQLKYLEPEGKSKNPVNSTTSRSL